MQLSSLSRTLRPASTIFFSLCIGEPIRSLIPRYTHEAGPSWAAVSALPASEAVRGDSESLIFHTKLNRPILILHAMPTQRRLATCF